MLILTGAFGFCLLLSCGGKGDTKESEWVMNAKLDSLITNMAACEQQNSNCPAYLKAEEGIKAMAKDTSFKNLVEELFNGIKYSSSGARSAACAHALTFWVYDYEIYKKPEYGRIVLDALKKEKFDEKLYYGSTLGQLLSGWLATDDEGLLKDLHAAVADKNVEMRGRRELIRLSGEMSFAKAGYVDLITSGRTKYLVYDYLERTFTFPAPTVALMAGKAHIKSVTGASENDSVLSYLAVWRKENGIWRFLAWQSCKNPEPIPGAK